MTRPLLLGCALLVCCARGGPPGGEGEDGGGLSASPTLAFTLAAPMVVGGHQFPQASFECAPDAPCLLDLVDAGVIAVDDPTVFEVAGQELEDRGARAGQSRHALSFSLRALKAGSTRLSASAVDSDGGVYALSRTIEARALERIELTPRCDLNGSAEPPFQLPAFKDISLAYAMFAGTEQLFGAGVAPVDAGSLAVQFASDRSLVLERPTSAMQLTITSPVDPTLQVPLEIYDARYPDGVSVALESGTPPLAVVLPATQLSLQVGWTIGGRRPCVGDIASIMVVSQTPGICGIAANGTSTPRFATPTPADGVTVPIWGFADGFCTVSVAPDFNTASALLQVELDYTPPAASGQWALDGTPEVPGAALAALWGTGPADVWAAGALYGPGPTAGLILHRDATGWSTAAPPASGGLNAVWGASATDVWFAGDGGAVLRFKDGVWSTVASGTTERLLGIWGTGSGDVWLVGSGGVALHWNGTSLDRRTIQTNLLTAPPNFTAVWGAGPNDVWVVGAVDFYSWGAWHWDGLLWSAVRPDPNVNGEARNLNAVWGTSGSDVWAAGEAGTVLHWNGGSWTTRRTGQARSYAGIWGTGAGDVWFGGGAPVMHWNGSAFDAVEAVAPSGAVWGAPSGELFATTSNGRILRLVR